VGDNIAYVVMNWLYVIIICFFCFVTCGGIQNWQHNFVLYMAMGTTDGSYWVLTSIGSDHS
jgi:hypothetical protein